MKDVEKSVVMAISETYLGPCQMCTMRFFAKIVFSTSFKGSKHLSAFRVKAHGGDETDIFLILFNDFQTATATGLESTAI